MRHHETSERTTRAPGRRHHADPTGEHPERSEGRPESADRPEPRTGQGGDGPGRPGPATTGGDAAHPPEHSPTVAPTPPQHDQAQQGGPQPDQPQQGTARPGGPQQGRPRYDEFRQGGPQRDQPQPGRPRHDESRPGGPGGPPPPSAESPQVPAQRTPPAYPQAMPQTPPLPSALPGMGPAPTAHGGHPRHAGPTPQERSQGPDDGRAARPGAAGADAEGIPDLLGPAEEGEFRRRWHEVQGQFVDDPRQAVHAADVLVGDVMRTLADTFARHRHTLEGQWSQGMEADTESLRLALRQYRALFQRMLST